MAFLAALLRTQQRQSGDQSGGYDAKPGKGSGDVDKVGAEQRR